MTKHIPFESIRNRPCDFIVKYRFFTPEEGGRVTGAPIQGYRSDFIYVDDEEKSRAWMIHPEFLDKDNNVILDKTIQVASIGNAQMWIVNENFFEYHLNRIKIGQKCFFVEGLTKTAECEVIEIVGLKKRTNT